MTWLTLILFVLGLVLLVAGAELLLRGATRLAIAIGISPLVVGLTVVSFGTSAPELAVGVQSAYAGQAGLALGNVVGSNIANILLILGLSAIIRPLVVSRQLIRQDVPIMIVASLIVPLLGWDGAISRWDGALLVLGYIGYTTFNIVQSRRQERASDAELLAPEDMAARTMPPAQTLVNTGKLLFGLALLVLGANWLVNGAVEVATAFGVSELIIGLTVVAVGTSLPEVAASVVASVRRQGDVAVGNAVGSNSANILLILGASALVAPGGVPVPVAALNFDIPIMIATAVACLPVFFRGFAITRQEGALFLGYYVAYTLYLVLAATNHDALPTFSWVMASFVLPLTAIGLIALGIVALRDERRRLRGL